MRTQCRSPNLGFRSLREDAPERGKRVKRKLLIADDEAAILNLIKDTLDSLGAEVVSTTDCPEVLNHLEQEKFDGGDQSRCCFPKFTGCLFRLAYGRCRHFSAKEFLS